MNQKTFILSIVIGLILLGCNNRPDKQGKTDLNAKTELVRINPLEELKQVDKLLSEIAEMPEQLTTPSDKKTTVTGAKGTIIHVDPNRLETVDGSPLGDNIEIELLEMTDKSSLLFNNAQTVSNGEILVTGGAYYLNMTSNGRQLRIKKGKGLEVEFPKLTENEMGLFLGERDSLGQINWIPTVDSFKPKIISNAEEPIKPSKKDYTEASTIVVSRFARLRDASLGIVDSIIAPKPVKKEDVTEEEYKEYLNNKVTYEKRQKQIQYLSKTYKAVELMNFGWINCDRFLKDPNPKTDIQILVQDDSLTGARMYAIFKDINSVISAYYWQGQKETASFRNIPIGKELHIIALSAKDEIPFIFETTINTKTDRQVPMDFTATTQAEIKEKLKRIN